MPPKPMLRVEEGRREGEQQDQLSSEIVTAQNRRASELEKSTSAALERGTTLKAKDEGATESESKEVRFSDEELDEVLVTAMKIKTFWENTPVDETTSPDVIQELAARLEQEKAILEDKQEFLASRIEETFEEEMEAKFKPIIAAYAACDAAIMTLREQQIPLLLRLRKSNLDQIESDHTFSIEGRIALLEQQAEFFCNRAKEHGKNAYETRRQAVRSHLNRFFDLAELQYQDAIASAKMAAQTWERSEQTCLELRKLSGREVILRGNRLKTTWQKNAEAWEKLYRSFFEDVEKGTKIGK